MELFFFVVALIVLYCYYQKNCKFCVNGYTSHKREKVNAVKCEDREMEEVAVEMVPLKETTASQPINNDTDKQEVKREPTVFNLCRKTIDKTTLPN